MSRAGTPSVRSRLQASSAIPLEGKSPTTNLTAIRSLRLRNCRPSLVQRLNRTAVSVLLSHAKRISLGCAVRPFGRQRRHRAGLLEPYISVELLGQHRLEIVAHEFGLRPIDDPDRAFEPRLAQRLDQLTPVRTPPIGQRPRQPGLAEHEFIAV